MLKALQIEILKSRRTKSYSIAIAMMIVSFIWEIFVKTTELHEESLRQLGLTFTNQTTETLFLPLAVSVFTSRIVANEKLGQTFKLQESNGISLLKIFHQKFFLSLAFFFVLVVIELAGMIFFAKVNDLSLSVGILTYKLLGEMLAISVLICLYLSLSLVLAKQGLVLALGFLGGFLGTVFSSQTAQLWSLLIPWVGSAFLAPYKFKTLSTGHYSYSLDEHLWLRLGIYLVYSLICYYLARRSVRKKGDNR